MNIITIEFARSFTFHIIPNLYITLGRSIYVTLSWLNLSLCIKHISTKYDKYMAIDSPSVTIHRYPASSYKYTFEISAFGYFYRKGLFRIKDREILPSDNTYGIVKSSWFDQFKGTRTFDSEECFKAMLRGIIEFLEKGVKEEECDEDDRI